MIDTVGRIKEYCSTTIDLKNTDSLKLYIISFRKNSLSELFNPIKGVLLRLNTEIGLFSRRNLEKLYTCLQISERGILSDTDTFILMDIYLNGNGNRNSYHLGLPSY